ncbi:MAG: acetoin utilization protein AcuC [Methanocellales archaeon]
MSGISALIYSEDYGKQAFTELPIASRYSYFYNILKQLGVLEAEGKVKHYRPRPATLEELLMVHSPEYIEFVKKMSERGEGYLDYGDTPAYKGCYELSCLRTGGSLVGAQLIMKGEAIHAFNPGGGFHHATRNAASGFCIFNDVVMSVRYLQRKYGVERIAIVDIDGHHADGTQNLLYSEPILKISLHRYGFIYPGTGNYNEIGVDEGTGYSVNIPLPRNTTHEAYLYAFSEVAVPLIEKYQPEIIINQFGTDAHFQDPLVGLALTTKTYEAIANSMHNLAHKLCGGRYLILGGGGYNPTDVARCWAIMFIVVSEAIPQERYVSLFDEVDITGITIFDKMMGIDGEAILRKVKKTVEMVKLAIFPYHGL